MMKKIILLMTIWSVCLFWQQGHAQNTHTINWQMGITSADASLSIDVGDTVDWVFSDAASHTVTSDAGSTETFDSGTLPSGSTYSHTFTTAGTNPYSCGLHPSMVGTITVQAPAVCADPSGLTLSLNTVYSLDLDWTENGAATAWDIEIGPLGFTPTGIPTHDDVSAKPYTIGNLLPLTTYDVYLRADCGSSTSAWVGPATSNTGCGVFPLPFVEDFETFTTSKPHCWQNTSSASTTWTFGTSPSTSNNYSDHTTGSGHFAYVDASSPYVTDATLETPPTDDGALTTPMLEFYVYHFDNNANQAANADNSLTVEVYDGSWQQVYFDDIGDVDAWEKVQIDVSAYSYPGPIMARFIVNTDLGKNDYNDIGIDDIRFAEFPTCSVPTALTATNIMATSAELGWTENNTPPASLWDIEIVPAGTSPTGTPSDAGVTNPYSKTGLSANTNYEFYVRADCGGGDFSAWAGPFAFTTPASGFLIFDDFETYTTGSMGTQAPWWTTWSGTTGGTEDIEVTTLQADSGTQSGLIAEGSTQDALLLLGNKTSGVYEISWDMYVPTGKTGYWNIQESETPGIGFNADFYIGATASGGTAGVITHDQSGITIPYTPDTWFSVKTTINLDNSMFSVSINNVPFLISEPYPGAQLGAIDFFSIDANNRYFIDDVLYQQPTCIAPTSISTIVTTTTSVDISWMPVGTSTTWEIEYGLQGFALGSGTSVIDNDGTAGNTITGLSTTTSYDFYIRTDCGGGDMSVWAGPFTFNTLCTTNTPPYTQDFSNNGSIPDCWAQGASNSKDWEFDDTVGSNHIGNSGDFYGTSSASGGYFAWVDDSQPGALGTTLETPYVDVSGLTTPALSFYFVSDNEGHTNVDFSVDFYDGATWNTAVFTSNTNTGGWTKIYIDLTVYTITGPVKARFIVDENNGSDFYDDVAIDDVSFAEFPSCPEPSSLAVTNQTGYAADLGWTEIGAATTWDVHVVPAGDPAPTATTTPSDPGVTTSLYNKTGLTPAADYEFYVRADCGAGDLSVWSGPFAFTTPCPTAYILPYSEDFTIDVAPDCWAEAGSGTPTSGPSGSSGSWFQDEFLNVSGSANQAAGINLASASDEEWLISPPFDLTGGSYELVYRAALTDAGNSNPPEPNGMGSDDEVQVLITTDGGTTWTNLKTYNQAGYPSHTGDLEVISLSAYTGTVSFAFWANEGSVNDPESSDFFIDDFEVRTPPACAQPTGLNVTNLTSNSADFNWTDNAGATTWNIEYGPAGFAPGTGTMLVDNDGTPSQSISGLDFATDYEFYVQADCGTDLSPWTGPSIFSTPCPTAIVPAYSEDFTSDVAPDCWEEAGSGTPSSGPSGTSGSWSQDDFLNDSGSLNQAAQNNFASASDEEWLISPSIDLSGGSYELVYKAAITAESAQGPPATPGMGSDDEVQVLISPDNGTTWTNLLTYNASNYPSHLGDLEVIDLSAYTGTVKIAFWANEGSTSDDDYDFFIDDFEVRTLSTCAQPTSLTVTGITATSADLGWTDNNSPLATTWDVHLVSAGGPAPTATTTPSNPGVTTNPLSLTSLTAQTAYEFYVRADCGGGDFSYWTGPFAFSTPCVAVAIPYTQDFSAGTFPGCWSRTSITDVSIEATCDTRTNVLRIDEGEDAITVPIDGTTAVNGLKVSYYLADSVCGDVADAGELFNVDYWDGTQWVTAMTYDASRPNAYTLEYFIVPLSDVTSGFKVRFDQVAATSVSTDSWLIDDVKVEDAPTCLAPNSLTAATITATSADLGWTDINSPAATTWDVYVVPAGDPAPTAATTPTDLGVTANPYNKTGLTGLTNYEFYVRTDCGGGDLSIWSGPFAFSTTCPVFTPDYSQDFATFLPDCWEEADGGDATTGPTTLGTSDWTFEDFLNTGSNQAANLNIFNTGDQSWLLSPEIDLSGGAYELSYMVAVTDFNNSNPETMGSDDVVEVLITTDGGTTWTVLETYDQANSPSATGTLELIDLTTYTGIAQIAFWVTNGAVDDPEDYDFFIDDFDVHTKPSCAQPSALTANSVLTTSADLGWTDANTPAASTWDVHVVPAGDPAPTATTTPSDPGVTANPYTKSGLNSGTAYEFYVRSLCGGGIGTSLWAGPFAFATTCTTAAIPYTETFSSGAFPVCWTRTSTTDVAVVATCGSRSNVLNISDTNDATTGLIDGTTAVNGLKVSYYIGETLCGGATEDPFDVSYWDGSQWVVVETYETDVVGMPYEDAYFHDSFIVPMSDVTAGFQVRFSSNETQALDNWYIDELVVEEAPSCLMPSALTAGGISASDADLGWTENNATPATTWDVHVVLAGDPAPTATTTPTDPGVTSNPYNKTGLTPQTSYEFYVRADCGGGDFSEWVGPYAFNTLCVAATIPYFEDFVSGTFPICWTRTSTTDVSIEATCDTRTEVLNISAANDVTTGPIDATVATNGLIVSYFIGDELCGGATEDPFDVSYWDGTQWVLAKTYLRDGSQPYENAYFHDSFTVPASAATADFKVRFSSDETINGDDWYIDDFLVELPPCADPSDIVFDNITQTQAEVSWTENGSATEWEIEYGPTGFAQGSGTLVADNDGTLGETISPLTPATVYDVYVRALCAGGTSGPTSAWIGPLSFTTLCDPLTAFPFTETFEDTSATRACWSNEYVSSEEDWEYVASNQNGTITPHNGVLMADFSTTNPQGDVTKLVSPAMDLTGVSNPSLEFYYANVNWNGDVDELRVYYRTSATGPWTQIGADYTTENTTWTHVTLSLPNPSNDYYVAFEGTSNYGRGVEVDDVLIQGTVGINDAAFNGFAYYPNPVSHQLFLEATNEIEQVVVYNLLGQEIINIEPHQMDPAVDVSNLQSGAYLMKVVIDGSEAVFRIIKE